MTIDKHTLDKARGWSVEILDLPRPQHSLDKAIAAAEVIRDLPETIVDGKELWELSRKFRAFAEDAEPEGEKGEYRATLYRNFAEMVEALLPAPKPQVEIALGAWAMHPEHGKVLICSTRVDDAGDVKVVVESMASAFGSLTYWVPATDLSPLPDTHDDSEEQSEYAPGGILPERASAEKEQMHRTLEKLNRQYTEPQPGEAWLVDCHADGTTEALYTSGSEYPWVFVDPDEPNERRWIYKSAVPLRRLVPAQEPRVLTTEADYENAAQNTVVRRSDDAPAIEKVDIGTWWSTEGHSYHDDEMAGTSRTVLWEPEA